MVRETCVYLDFLGVSTLGKSDKKAVFFSESIPVSSESIRVRTYTACKGTLGSFWWSVRTQQRDKRAWVIQNELAMKVLV